MGFQGVGQVQRRLAAELDDDAVRLFLPADVEHVFQRQGFEEELVRGIVVRGDGFRIGVDDDGFIPHFPQGHGGVHAAVVEFDALADAVRSAAQDEDFFPSRVAGFVFVPVGGVEVGGVSLEFRGAGVHQAVAGNDALFAAFLPHGFFRSTARQRDLAV